MDGIEDNPTKKEKAEAISNNENESRHIPYNASPFSTCSNSEGGVSIEWSTTFPPRIFWSHIDGEWLDKIKIRKCPKWKRQTKIFNQGIFEFQSKCYLILHELFSMFSFFFTWLLEESGYKSQHVHTILISYKSKLKIKRNKRKENAQE